MRFFFDQERRGETLVSIVVGVFILAFVIVSITNIIATNYSLEDDYNRNNALFLLQNNATNVIKKINTAGVNEGELFYLYKDATNRSFKIMTGTSNEWYRYINANGEPVTDTGAYQGIVYTRMFLNEKNDTSLGILKQVIKTSLKELIRK